MNALKTTTETMNQGIQAELGLNFSVALEVSFDNQQNRVYLVNRGRTNLYIWGIKVDGAKPMMDSSAKLLAPGSQYYFPGSVVSSGAGSNVPDGSHRLFPFFAFVKNDNGVEFVVESTLFGEWKNGRITFSSVTTNVRQSNWTNKRPSSSQVPS